MCWLTIGFELHTVFYALQREPFDLFAPCLLASGFFYQQVNTSKHTYNNSTKLYDFQEQQYLHSTHADFNCILTRNTPSVRLPIRMTSIVGSYRIDKTRHQPFHIGFTKTASDGCHYLNYYTHSMENCKPRAQPPNWVIIRIRLLQP